MYRSIVLVHVVFGVIALITYWMAGLSPIGATEEDGMSTMRSYAESYGRFAGGVVRGALEALGLRCVVSCEPICSITGDPPPGCKFRVRLTGGLGFGGIA